MGITLDSNKNFFTRAGRFIDMFSFDIQFSSIAREILINGYEELNERTGLHVKRIPGQVITITSDPIMYAKKLYWKSAIEEILWIMQKGSNNIHDLRPHIWDEWADETGSIKKAYGYQILKYHQVEKLLDTLSKDPSSRRGVINLWNVADLDEMALVPCCYSSVWSIIDGKLNCMLVQRSGDMGLGVPFNTTQYWVLLLMFARHLNVRPGKLTHCIADAHIYENQYAGMEEYLTNFNYINLEMHGNKISTIDEIDQEKINDVYDVCENITKSDYIGFSLNPEKTNFWDFTIDDIKLVNYKSMKPIKFDVVV